ncbi:hypothetical protein NDU88_005961 [Pleurodeles waltl]|uniref:Uncharacterized protein n=1 Tax=Pleurodeles waltl TaxID=8319 RepID=A0AAV7QJS5_PLEWA|nr:hypothetical protein NDU88_005961 [Pleurodeles waltl]
MDKQTPMEGDFLARGPFTERQRGSRQNKLRKVGSPSHIEMQKERQKAKEAAASLNGSELGAQVQITEELTSQIQIKNQ